MRARSVGTAAATTMFHLLDVPIHNKRILSNCVPKKGVCCGCYTLPGVAQLTPKSKMTPEVLLTCLPAVD